MDSSGYFVNRECPYFPCHEGVEPDNFNCLFCYCPLYALGDACGGSFRYTGEGIKDCSGCPLPHRREAYDRIVQGCARVVEQLRKGKSE